MANVDLDVYSLLIFDYRFKEFAFWFYPMPQYHNLFEIYHLLSKTKIGTINASNRGVEFVPGHEHFKDQKVTILNEFLKFNRRPEYLVSSKVLLPANVEENAQEYAETYCTLLIGSYLLKAWKKAPYSDPDRVIPSLEKSLSWLAHTDFFYAPSSSKYHEPYPHGLVDHTLKVFNRAIQLKECSVFRDVPYESVAFAALCHDFCKINLYEMYLKNQKNDETGDWEKVPAYRRRDPSFAFGHGESSMFITMKLFSMISDDEALAIRWHMARWYTAPELEDSLTTANKRYPIVHLIQFADQLSIVNY